MHLGIAGAQKLQHFRPSTNLHCDGRHGQPFAAPRVVANAGGGLVVEVQLGKLGVVQDAGYKATNARDRNVVAFLGE